MAKMTQVIQPFPPAPQSTMSQIEFNSKADAFVHHQADTYVTEVNTWKDQANALEGEMNNIKTSIDSIVATIPAGSIDDTATATDKVWSSTKVTAELSNKWDDTSNEAVGVNQTWQDVSANRQNNGVYTNHTGKPIMVIVTVEQATPNTLCGYKFVMGSLDIDQPITKSSSVTARLSSTYIVPHGETYQIVIVAGRGALSSWVELR